MLLCAIEREEEQRDLAVRVAEEVGRWLVENGFSVDGKGASGAHEAREQHVPHNAVTAFLQKWGDDD
jgi:hypothetical protein